MKHVETEIKRVYSKLIMSFFIIAGVAFALQLSNAQHWAALIPQAINDGEIWRVLSAHFIHINWNHFAMNMAGTALCIAVFRFDVAPKHWLISAIFISLFSSLFLYLSYQPQQSYVGFSDTLHGWLVIGMLAMLSKEPKLAGIMLTVFIGKLLYENFVEPPSAHLLAGSRVATESHLFGAMGGLVYSFIYNKELRHFSLTQINRHKKTG
ncbi:MAG: rhombosortase [Pseudomonadales bacterium]|nr:rhombosortase [Pseudomonadales bacterium]